MENHDEILLERFFERSLSSTGKAELERRLAGDPDLAAEFQWQQQAARAVNRAEADALKAILQDEEAKLSATPMRVSWRNTNRLLAIAACLVAVAAAVLFLRPARPTPERLFADNFQPFDNRFAARGSEPSAMPDSLFQAQMRTALQPYDQKNYAAALETLKTVKTETPEQQSAVHFYSAVCLEAQKQFGPAADLLRPIAAQKGFYQAPALWHLALAEIGAGHLPEAKTALEAYLAHPDGIPKRSAAKQLLSEF